MRVDTPDLDKGGMAAGLRTAFGLEVTSVEFLPVGEDSYVYAVRDRAGARYLVRALEASRAADLEGAMAAAHHLRTDRGLPWVVAPQATAGGRFTLRRGGFVLAVFPFVEGTTAHEESVSDEDLARLAAMVASLHRTPGPPGTRRWDFSTRHGERLKAVLAASPRVDPGENPHRRHLRDLLLHHREGILGEIDRLEGLRTEARAAAGAFVLTHGDPSGGNILRDAQGGLHIVDWDAVGLGPPERDLMHFAGERFPLFLQEYRAVLGDVELREEAFAFYLHDWILQEIADYGERILWRDRTREESAHHWSRLEPYLPLPLGEVEETLGLIRRDIRKT